MTQSSLLNLIPQGGIQQKEFMQNCLRSDYLTPIRFRNLTFTFHEKKA